LREGGDRQDKIGHQHKEQHKKKGSDSPSQISNTQGTVPASHKSSDKLSVDFKFQTNEQNNNVNTRNEYSTRNKSKHPPKMQNDDKPEILDAHIDSKDHSEIVEGIGLTQEGSVEAKEETLHGSTTKIVEGVNHKPVEAIERHEKKNGKSIDKKDEAMDNSTVKINGKVDKSSPPSPLEKNGGAPPSSSQSQHLKSSPPPPRNSRSQSEKQRSESKSSKKVLSSSLPSKMEQRLAFEKKRGEQKLNNSIQQQEQQQQQQAQQNLQHQQVELQNIQKRQVELQRQEQQKRSVVVNIESTEHMKVIDNLPQNSSSNDDRGERPEVVPPKVVPSEVVPPKTDSLRGRRRAAAKRNNNIKSSSSNNTKGCPPPRNSTSSPSSSWSSPRSKQKQTEEDTTTATANTATTTTRKRARRLCSSQHLTNGDNKINGNETNNLSGSIESQVNTRNGDRRNPSRDSRKLFYEEDEDDDDDDEDEEDDEEEDNSNNKSPRKPEKNSVRDEERQIKGQIRTGSWSKEETMAFLHGVRIHGKGNWSTIADVFIPTRYVGFSIFFYTWYLSTFLIILLTHHLFLSTL